jgi:hypothetical protein
MPIDDETDLQNAEQQRAYHEKLAAKPFGTQREQHLGLMRHYENEISQIKTRITKRAEKSL